MAVMVVFSMVAYWNDWFTALIYMTGEGRAAPCILPDAVKNCTTPFKNFPLDGRGVSCYGRDNIGLDKWWSLS